MYRFTKESPADYHEVENLYDLTFAPGRTALSSYRLRDDIDPLVDLGCIARDEYDVLAGVLRFWPVRIGDAGDPALLLGPIAVHPTRQGEGLGAMLMAEGLSRGAAAGWKRVVLVGDLPYYSRFGFERVPVTFPPPTNPDRVLGRELLPGGLEGITGEVRRWTEAP